MSKRIIINADDFGLTSGINYGIIDAYLHHSISSISMMVNTPQTLQAVKLMKKYQLDCVGIHVNVTLGNPVSNPQNVPSLVDENGNFHQSQWWFENDVNEDELIKEFDNQIQLFKDLTGQVPNHINYHHRYDFYQHYPKLAQHLFSTYQLPMRLERDEEGYPYEYAINQSYFLAPQDSLKDYLTGDLIEMPCHVGFVDKQIMEISSLNLQRMEDHAKVNSEEFKQIYQQAGYQLVGWNQVNRK